MKYGKLDNIDGVEFIMPPDHPQTALAMPGKPAEKLDIFVGGTMWNIPKWKGKIYPEKTPANQMMERYCEQFGTIELNATHYRIHPPTTIRKWHDGSPSDFKFCPKFPQLITHYRRFNNCEGLVDEFIQSLLAFEQKLSPSFIQLPPNFTPNEGHKLITFFKTWPRELLLSIEFRHPRWFEDEEQAEEVWAAMQEHGIGAVICDTAGRRDAMHMRSIAPWLLLRFGGYEGHPTDALRFNQWMDRIEQWKAMGLREVHLLMHQPDSILTPESCIDFALRAEERFGVEIKKPHLIKGATLF
ncbi:MAG: DUF72 domain-containing protein [Flavobacteriales bacterium]|nr:DUF72 domain-containing protein [Flavobacteriales bacterium]